MATRVWHMRLSWALGLALLACLVSGTLVLKGIRAYYARELRARAQASGALAVSRNGNASGLPVLFLGDSRAAQWPPLRDPQFLSISAAWSGGTTAQILRGTRQALAEIKPAVVVLQAGINDLKAIGVLPREEAAIEAQCLNNLVEIVSCCQQQRVPVILTLILPAAKISWARRLVWSPAVDLAVRSVNESLAEHFRTVPGVLVVDLESELAQEPQRAEDYRDALHLKPAAYQKFEGALRHAIGQLTRPRKPLSP